MADTGDEMRLGKNVPFHLFVDVEIFGFKSQIKPQKPFVRCWRHDVDGETSPGKADKVSSSQHWVHLTSEGIMTSCLHAETEMDILEQLILPRFIRQSERI
eukprot:749049-Hanusia_phi.AAC.4